MPHANPSPLTLQPLGPAEENLLCGRDSEVRAILENCEAGRLTVLLSPPGLGASSVLGAGVQPALRRAGTIVVTASSWDGRTVSRQLHEIVTDALRAQGGETGPAPPQESLNELLLRARAQTGKPIALLLDQFEDYLRCHAGTDVADAFDAELSHAVSSRAALFVIAMHSSAVDEFERLSQFIPNLLGYTITLAPLSREAAADLVRRRAAAAHLRIEPSTVAEIIAAPCAAMDGGVNPALIAVAAQNIRVSGGADRMILTSLDPVFNTLSRSERRLLLQWLKVLVTQDSHRIAVSLKGLTQCSSAQTDAVESLLAALIGAGVLRQVNTRFGARYLLSRDSTAPIVQDWGERMRRIHATRVQTFFRAISVLVGLVALIAAYMVYYGGK